MKDRFLLTPFFLGEAVPALEPLAEADWRTNRPALPEGTALERMSTVYRSLAELVAETVAAGERPVSVAGDCCATIGTMAGLARAGLEPVLVWLDAHGDFNTWETSPSGFVGGMPLAMLVGLGEQSLLAEVGLEPFPEERVVLTDARDLDPGERALVEASAVLHLDDPRELLTRPLPAGPLYVHLDVDVVDPGEVPAVAYPTPGGLGSAELGGIFRRLARSREIAAVSVSTWSPELDRDGRSREVSMGLVRALGIVPG